MAIAEHFAPAHTTSNASAIQIIAARISAHIRARSDARRTKRAVRYLSDHIKRDIGLLGAKEKSNDFYAGFGKNKSHYVW